MSVRIERDAHTPVCIAHLRGDVDMAVVPDVRAGLDAELASGCSHVVLDLSEVRYADSSALGLLVWLSRRLAPAGGQVILANADANVSRVLEISGLVGITPVIRMASSVDDAMAGLDLAPVCELPSWERRFELSPVAEGMGEVRNLVCDAAEAAGMAGDSLFDLKVAAGEAIANAVRHGSPGGEGEIGVAVSAYTDRVVVSIADSGPGFDGEPPAGEDVYASGGRGVQFMRALTDRVEFEPTEGGGTTVRLTKRLCAPGGPDPDATGPET